jgi:quercetin dioxygenase-like cupin family protein
VDDFSRGVTLTEHVEVPIGVTVGIWTFEVGGELRYNPNHKDYADMGLTVLSGSGQVETDDAQPQPVTTGSFIFVRGTESLNLTTETGLVLLAIGGGWLYPG